MTKYSKEFILSLKDKSKTLEPPQWMNIDEFCVGFIGPLQKSWSISNKKTNSKAIKKRFKKKIEQPPPPPPFKSRIQKHDIKAFNNLISLVNKISDKKFDILVEQMKPICKEIDGAKLVDYLFQRISVEQNFIDIYVRLIKSLNIEKDSLTEMCIKHTENLNKNKAEGIGRIYKHSLITKNTIEKIIKMIINSRKEGNEQLNYEIYEILSRLLITVKVVIPELKMIEDSLTKSILISISNDKELFESYLELIYGLNINKIVFFKCVKKILKEETLKDKKLIETLMEFLTKILSVNEIKELISIFEKEITKEIEKEIQDKNIINLKTGALCVLLKNEYRLNLNKYLSFLLKIKPYLETRVKFLVDDVKDAKNIKNKNKVNKK